MSSTSGKRSKGRSSTAASTAGGPKSATAAPGPGTKAKKGASAVDARKRQNRIIGVVVVVVVAVLAIGVGWMFISRPSGSVATGTGGAAMAASQGLVEQGNGGSWTNVSADTLAAMLAKKDFTFLNVKTPYIGEIEGTDLYIPYTDLTAKAATLPEGQGGPDRRLLPSGQREPGRRADPSSTWATRTSSTSTAGWPSGPRAAVRS